MTTPTTNYGWGKPIDGGDFDNWGAELNAALDAIDGQVKANDTAAQGYATTAQGNSLQKSQNLADLGSLAATLGNLGLTGNSGGTSWGGNWLIRIPVEISGAAVDVIVQGGVVSGVAADTGVSLTFPTAFPSYCWGVYPTIHLPGAFFNGNGATAQLNDTPTRTGCSLGNKNTNGLPTADIVWWAIGI